MGRFTGGHNRRRQAQRHAEQALRDQEPNDVGRLIGSCSACGRIHRFPDLRQVCPTCGESRCVGVECCGKGTA